MDRIREVLTCDSASLPFGSAVSHSVMMFCSAQELVESYYHEDTMRECGFMMNALQKIVEITGPPFPESLNAWAKEFIAEKSLHDVGNAKRIVSLYVSFLFPDAEDYDFMYIVIFTDRRLSSVRNIGYFLDNCALVDDEECEFERIMMISEESYLYQARLI